VCIVDTGIEMTHPDLKNANLIAYRDFVGGDDQTIQDRGNDRHGTMMAGILVADGEYRGAAPNVGLVVAAALNSDGSTQSESTVAQAVEWCWDDMNVDIISLSLGGDPDPENPLGSQTADAVSDALDHGVFVVAAAGNSGGAGTGVTDVSVPANVDGVIAVGAVDRDGNLWERTATGSETEGADGETRLEPNQKPEVSAPGVGIISTSDPSFAIPYSTSSGTSDATVFVTGALALILERHGDAFSPSDSSRDIITLVKQALADSCQRNPLQGEGHHPRWGYGVLDAVAWERAVADNIVLNSDT
jgi:serine protease AprX